MYSFRRSVLRHCATLLVALIAALPTGVYASQTTIYEINQAQAFRAARYFMGLMGRREGEVAFSGDRCIRGEVMGVESLYEYNGEPRTQSILVIPVSGFDSEGKEIRGFTFEVKGNDVEDFRTIDGLRTELAVALEQAVARLGKTIASVDTVERRPYEDYGFEEVHTWEELTNSGDLGAYFELESQCLIPEELVAPILNSMLNIEREPMGVAKAKLQPAEDLFKTFRTLDEYFYNINIGTINSTTDDFARYRAGVYETVMREFASRNDIQVPKEDVKAYRSYLFKNSRRLQRSMDSASQLIGAFATRMASIWYTHRAIFEMYGGSVSVEDGWLPVEGYLKIVRKYEEEGIVSFPSQEARERFFHHFQVIIDGYDLSPTLPRKYYEVPWWRMNNQTLVLFAVRNFIEE